MVRTPDAATASHGDLRFCDWAVAAMASAVNVNIYVRITMIFVCLRFVKRSSQNSVRHHRAGYSSVVGTIDKWKRNCVTTDYTRDRSITNSSWIAATCGGRCFPFPHLSATYYNAHGSHGPDAGWWKTKFTIRTRSIKLMLPLQSQSPRLTKGQFSSSMGGKSKIRKA